jgi:CRP/FNR family cyclic AMP-dependent transcriptional regulator
MNGIQVLLPRPGHWDRASSSDWAEVLATFPLFSGIAQRRLRKLVRNATFAEYGPGDMVIQKGTSGDSLYLILSGSAKALGKPASRTLRTGDYFGELSLLDGTPRSATVIATGELHVMKLPGQTFLELAQDPEISLQMLRTLGSQIRRLEARPAQL